MAILSATVAAAGSSQATATEIASRFTTVTGGDGAVGVRLTQAAPGTEFWIYNAAATGGVKVYPHVGGDINDGTQDAAVVIEGKTLAVLACMDGTTWAARYTVDT
jgi:hypothetical protein